MILMNFKNVFSKSGFINFCDVKIIKNFMVRLNYAISVLLDFKTLTLLIRKKNTQLKLHLNAYTDILTRKSTN